MGPHTMEKATLQGIQHFVARPNQETAAIAASIMFGEVEQAEFSRDAVRLVAAARLVE